MKNRPDPKNISELKIYKQGRFCGILSRNATGGVLFTYDAEYLALSETKDLCFNLPKRVPAYAQEGVNLHPFFAGLLPEGLRLKILQETSKTSSDDLFSFFAAMGGDCVGDVHSEEFIKDESRQVKPQWNKVRFYDYYFEVLKQEGHKEVQSIPGVQEKISASMLSLPLQFRSTQGSYILKLSPKDKPNLIFNEWVCLSLARQCGLDVNNFHLIEDQDKNHGLLVERFDRFFNAETQQMYQIHQEDMCQILNIFPAEKYRVSISQIFSAIGRFSSSPKIDQLNLLRLIVFSYLIGNGDLHAKNISLCVNPENGRVALTPAYDIICTLIYGDQKMALKMDSRDSKFKRQHFVNFGMRYGLSKVSIESMMDDLINLFELNHAILFSIDMSDKRANFLAKEIIQRIKALSIPYHGAAE